MVQKYEIVAFILGLIALTVILVNRKQLRNLSAQKFLIAGFSMFLASWVLTNLESFFWADTLNVLEHVSQATGGVLVAVWCWRVFGKAEKQR